MAIQGIENGRNCACIPPGKRLRSMFVRLADMLTGPLSKLFLNLME